MMDFQSFSREIGFSEAFIHEFMPHFRQLWDHSSEAFPAFMEREFYTQYYPLCRGPAEPAEVFPLMDEVVAEVRSNPAAARYASMLHYALFLADPQISLDWPSPTGIFDRNTGIFQLMVALSALPLVEKKYAEMKLPEEQFLGIARWIGGTMLLYGAAHDGYPGHSLKQTCSLRHSIDGELFRIGRLEYWARSWNDQFPAVYRDRNRGRLAVLCRDGWAFDEEGFRVDPKKERPAFTARLRFRSGRIAGIPVTPYGKPVRGREMTLDLKEWEPLCAPWDPCVTVHVPAGGGMTLEAVRDSLAEAKRFYRKYFDTDIRVFTCASWILNPDLEKELPDTHFAELQRNVYLTPCPPPPENGLFGTFFVYGEDNCDPRSRPRTTRLHHALCRILDRGGKLRTGRMFLPADDVELFGTQYYRKNYSL